MLVVAAANKRGRYHRIVLVTCLFSSFHSESAVVTVDSSHYNCVCHTAIWLCQYLLRGVVSVSLQILLVGTCRLCCSYSKRWVMSLRYWQGNRLVIHRSRVRVLAGQHCIVVLGNLLTPVCLCQQAVHFSTDQGAVISFAGKVTAGLVESNDSLPPGLWLMSPAGWLPRNWDQLRA